MPGAERIIDFAESPVYLSQKYEQLVIHRDDDSDVTVPMAEIAAVILSSTHLTITQPALAGIMRHGGSVIICDKSHQPVGMMLPLSANTTQTQRMLAQVRAAKPLCKRLWQQIVKEKIRAQAASLQSAGRGDGGLPELAKLVRSGDPSNVEARAAQRYWPMLFDDPAFRRRREADNQNRLLNYGYAILRAAVGRAICGAGLHPSIGLHHHGRNNPYSLADDLMEPYRPLVDIAVVELTGIYGADCPLDGKVKQALVSVLTDRLLSDGESRSVFDWISRTASSLSQVFLSNADRLNFPQGLRHAQNAT